MLDEYHFVLTFATNHVFFIDIGSKVTPQSRNNVNNTGTIQRRHRKLYWMIWAHVLFNLDIIALKTAIDTSYWNFKKLFNIQCNHVIIQKCINDVIIEFINVLMETCTHFYLAKLCNFLKLHDGHWYFRINFHIGENFAEKSRYLACWHL